MLGDTYPRLGDESAAGYSEYYVCPEAFAGQYRILLKRVWGRPTAGKVTVDIVTHSGTEKEQSGRQQIALETRTPPFVFDLDQGRRKEALDAHKSPMSPVPNRRSAGRS